MPDGLIEALDLIVTRRVARGLPGDRRAPGVGAGTELAQLRPYQVGDDVRHIDAAATARTGEPHVRAHVPERTLTTWVVLDVSPSMAFGTEARLKADIAEGVALVLGRLAVRRAGAVGLVRFGAGDAAHVQPPRGAKPGIVALRRALAEGVAPDGLAHPNALADALARVGRVARGPGVVAIISDFRDQAGWERALGALRVHHAVMAIEIADPREAQVPAVGYSRAIPDLTLGQVREAQRVKEAFEKVLDTPGAVEALQNPVLKPLLDEAAA